MKRAVIVEQVVVIGGGVVGLLCALELTDRGVPVRVLESPDSHPPASWAGGGILSPLFPWRYSDPMSALCQHAVAAYESLALRITAAGGPDPEVSRTPLLCLCDDPAGQVEGWARRWRRQLRRCEAAELYPHLHGEAWLLEDAASIRNPRLLKGLRALLAQRGVVPEQVRVRALEESAVRTESGLVPARQIIIAAGHGSAALLEGLGIAHDLQPVKGQMLRFAGIGDAPAHVLLSEQGYVIPRSDGSVLVGSTLEPGRSDTLIDKDTGKAMSALAMQLWPPLAGQTPENHWAGVRPGRGRDVPVIDALEGWPGVWLCTGHYRNGLVSAPASARLLVQRLMGETPSLNACDYSFSSPGSSDSFCSR